VADAAVQMYRRLRSSSTSALDGAHILRATIGDRAFPAAAASVCNSQLGHRYQCQFSTVD